MKELEACQVLVPEAVRVRVHSCFLLSLDTPVAHTRLYRMSLAVLRQTPFLVDTFHYVNAHYLVNHLPIW